MLKGVLMSKEIMEVVDRLVASINSAHRSTSQDWKAASFGVADDCLLEINKLVKEMSEWKEAVDRELVILESTADSYTSPREAVKAVIDWNVAVATDPKVNGNEQFIKDIEITKNTVVRQLKEALDRLENHQNKS
jgi:hypothetical protein